jgi:hypothetical protein
MLVSKLCLAAGHLLLLVHKRVTRIGHAANDIAFKLLKADEN